MAIEHEDTIDVQCIHELIAVRAYELYEARGYVHGFAVQDWLNAKQEVFSHIPRSAIVTRLRNRLWLRHFLELFLIHKFKPI